MLCLFHQRFAIEGEEVILIFSFSIKLLQNFNSKEEVMVAMLN